MFFRIRVLKNIANFTGKHVFKNTFFTKHLDCNFWKKVTFKKSQTNKVDLPFNDTGKNCMLLSSVQEYWNGRLAASDIFHWFRQPIKFYTFHCHILQMHRCLNKTVHRKEYEWLLFSQKLLRQNLSWFLSQHRKTLCLRAFILKTTERM